MEAAKIKLCSALFRCILNFKGLDPQLCFCQILKRSHGNLVAVTDVSKTVTCTFVFFWMMVIQVWPQEEKQERLGRSKFTMLTGSRDRRLSQDPMGKHRHW